MNQRERDRQTKIWNDSVAALAEQQAREEESRAWIEFCGRVERACPDRPEGVDVPRTMGNLSDAATANMVEYRDAYGVVRTTIATREHPLPAGAEVLSSRSLLSLVDDFHGWRRRLVHARERVSRPPQATAIPVDRTLNRARVRTPRR